jgi:hypothetical protein
MAIKKKENGFTGEFLVSYRIRSNEFNLSVSKFINGDLKKPLSQLLTYKKSKHNRIFNLRIIPLFDPLSEELQAIQSMPYEKLVTNYDYSNLLPHRTLRKILKKKILPKYKPKTYKRKSAPKTVYTPETLRYILKALNMSYHRLSKLTGISGGHIHKLLTAVRPISYEMEKTLKRYVLPLMTHEQVTNMPIIEKKQRK